MHLDLTDLRLFQQTLRAGSITAGAEASGLSLSAASARLAGMETALGAKLLLRGRRGVTPTAAGATLAEHADRVLAEMGQLRDGMRGFARTGLGRVRIVANTGALAGRLSDDLAAFLAQDPSVDLDLHEATSAEAVAAVARGAAEIALAADHADRTGLFSRPYQHDPLALALPPGHPLAGRAEVALREALAFDFIGLDADSALQRHVEDHAARGGGRLRLRVRVRQIELLGRMAAAGVGLAVVPLTAAARWPKDAPRLVPLSDPWAQRWLHLIARDPAALPPPAARCLAHLLGAAETPPAGRP